MVAVLELIRERSWIQKSSLVMGGLLTGMIILYQRFILFCNYDIIGIAKIYGFFHKKSGLKREIRVEELKTGLKRNE